MTHRHAPRHAPHPRAAVRYTPAVAMRSDRPPVPRVRLGLLPRIVMALAPTGLVPVAFVSYRLVDWNRDALFTQVLQTHAVAASEWKYRTPEREIDPALYRTSLRSEMLPTMPVVGHRPAAGDSE